MVSVGLFSAPQYTVFRLTNVLTCLNNTQLVVIGCDKLQLVMYLFPCITPQESDMSGCLLNKMAVNKCRLAT